MPIAAADLRAPTTRGRRPWGLWAVQRLLLLHCEPITQQYLAAQTGLSKQSIYNVLRSAPDGITKTPAGVLAVDRATVLDDFLAHYPGPSLWTTAGDIPQGVMQANYFFLGPTGSSDEVYRQAVLGAARRHPQRILSVASPEDTRGSWHLVPSLVLVADPQLIPRHAEVSDCLVPAEWDRPHLSIQVPCDPTVWRTARAAHALAARGEGIYGDGTLPAAPRPTQKPPGPPESPAGDGPCRSDLPVGLLSDPLIRLHHGERFLSDRGLPRPACLEALHEALCAPSV